MESNNHFNYGTHSSANSGLKLSSGDSLYTNGSSMSFPQQGKNMNGEMNVNGATTVLGSSVPGSHPPTAPYPHMSNHHQSNMGYDYLWGGHPQYGPAMGSSPGHGMHPKQPTPGMAQPQSQHHFQGHGQYQLNGGIESSHQPPVAGPPNMPLTGSQYWNRNNPGPQQIGYNSHSMYGTYQSQAHPGITPSQHHQQQSLQPPPHQPSQQHLHSHRHPHHHHQQHQQPQHYGMMPNGMPYYQHQPQHPTLPSPQQQQQQPQQSQPQGQAPMMPPAAQNFTPPRGSPQHHSLGRGGTGSPLPVGMTSAPMMSPSAVQDSGSPKNHNRDSSVGMPSVMQGHTREAVKEVDTSYNGNERAPVAQRLPKTDSYQSKPSAAHVGPTSDYQQHSDQPAAQCPEVVSPVRDATINPPPQFVSSQQLSVSPSSAAVSVSLTKAPAASAPSGSPISAPGPPVVPSHDVESTPPQISVPTSVSSAQSPAASPRLSSPPLVQGLRPPPSSVTEISPAGSKHLSAGSSSSSLPASPLKTSTPLASTNSESRPSAVSLVPPVSSSLESVAHQSALPPTASGPYTTVSPPAIVSTSSYSMSTPISSLEQMVQGSKVSCFPDASGAQHEQPGPPRLMSATSAGLVPPLRSISGSSTSTPPDSCLSTSASPMSVSVTPSVGSKLCEPAPTPQHQTYTPPSVDTGLSPASAASSPPGGVNLPSLAAHESRTVQPLSTLPLLTTQASRTAPVSAPPALVSLPPAMGTSSGVVQSSDSEQHPPNTTPPCALKQSFPKPEHHGHSMDRKALSNKRNEKPEEHLSQLDSDTIRTPQRVEVTETHISEICSHKSFTDLPGKPLQTNIASDKKAENKQTDFEKHHMQSNVSDICETEDSLRKSQLHSSRVEHMTDEESFDNSSCAASQFDSNSKCDTPSRIEVSSIFEKTSHLGGDSSCIDHSTDFDYSSHLRKDTSQFDSTSHAEGEASTVFDTTRESSFSVEDSRDDTLDSTREGETSEAEETKNSCQTTGESMLESSLNNTSQMEEPSVDSSDVSNLSSFVQSQPGRQGPEAEWEPRGHDTPDSAGRISIKTTVNEAMTPPSFKMRDENFIAFSTPAESPAVHPLQPVTDQIVSAARGQLKTPGKPRKPRAPKAIWIKTPAPEEAQRKPRARTPKVEKIKTEEQGGNKEEGATGRKRKKSLKVDVKETSDVSGEAGPPAEEFDSITATIEAVLANASAINTAVEKPKKAKRAKKQDQEGNVVKTQKQDAETAADDGDENDDDSSTAGESNRRRVATEDQVQFPLMHGWKREIRVKKTENRMKGETWYYTPCGRRMKQFPEIVKYLKRHTDSVVTREHFSFSPRMPVGDFYEERETPEGMKWVLLANEEVPSMIMAITGRRGRPPNPDKEKSRRVRGVRGGQARRPGRPPKPKMIDLLSKVDAKLLKRLEAKEALTEEEKEKLAKIKKKMKRKARMKRREDAKIKKMREEKKKAKLEQEAKAPEVKAEPTDPAAPQVTQPASESAAEPKKPGRRRSVKLEATPPIRQTDEERIAQGKRVLGARSKAKALAKAQAEAEAAAQAALSAKRAAERRAQAQRRLEERKRQQLIAEELKKPTEDMCLTDHKPLPELSRIPGVVLSGTAFAHCLAVVEFLHGYGKLIGLNVPKDIPSLATLQEGLLGLGDNQGEVQDLLIKLVEAALHDPGLPSYYQSVKILGEKLVELELTRSTVSEVLRIFLESHGYETEVCNSLRTKTFHALPPDTKAAILGFLVEELNSSNIVTSDIDNTLENMATYRKNKWIIEGKLRKLKTVLARRTGRSEEELCFEERRRSARVAEEENLSLEESGVVLERGNRRARKEEPKLSDSESPTNASIPELERQIDKLTKRQAFFRKKLLQSSHSMRAILLGQDRFRRRYLALPHLGGVLVEGPEELLTSGDVLVAEVPVTFLKKEPKVEETPIPTTPPPTLPSSPSSATPTQTQTLSPEEDPLPGTASLMSRPRGRGRPRKIKPEVELHLRTAKIRRRRRSSVRSGGEDGPGSPNSGTQDLTQAAFQNWLSQSQEAVTNGTCSAAGEAPEGNRPEESVKEMAEKQGQWFNLLPKQPCDDNSITEPQMPTSPSSPPKLLPQIPSTLPALAAPLMQPDPLLPGLAPADPVTPQSNSSTTATPQDPAAPASADPVGAPPPLPQLLPAPIPPAPAAPTTPARPTRRRRRGSRGSSPARRGPRGAAAKRRGRPPNSVFQELEQQYFTQLVVKPIPASMVRGWWWIKDPEELYSTLQALHPRGIREKVLHKHLAKHMESLAEMCTKPINDPVFELKVEEKDVLMEALQQPWQVQEKAMETDVSALQWVEDLEQRVIAADLHLKAPPQCSMNDTESNTETPMAEFQPYTIPDPDSTRDDLQYYEHDADPRDDWIVRTKKEWSGLPRIATHPLDLAVLRLANLERNIERRYLKEPLWNPAEVMRLAPLTPTPGEEHPMDVISLESEITSRLRTWRQALDRCRSAPQLCLCLLQLEKAIAWERSVTKVTCQVCRKGDNDECLLLCDSCDRGCHMYCLRPKITQVPEGDWFCPTCIAKEEGEPLRSSKMRIRVKKRRYEDDSSEDEMTTRRSSGMATRNKDSGASSSSSRYSGEGGSTKRRRMTTRNQPDLTFCEIILMEMEAHADAWPFLEPVNPRLVPGYRRIIKNPMDFLTMRERLLQGGYCSCEEFAADAQLVFNNCELFNEDTSEVGMAGHSMRRFFESRWAEFYSNKDK
ncbi:bromodomain adjacent to zinc finger domain protein 2A [Toxotes jaculatrix]|uniref:bromodomain adjacent to zinc finger domain protein 2A n=1 Tax=Toxotes jaculatrix TaxID=941984 RepID=UPI001B3B17E9|nr:bromodomain adjacent to zinc finger domain protein 2A [Toxotes jaculatrix]XP_040905158.1 bromodomain adjacent to zinc finger domain protein 2A [Toxotes jaculatrix]XP_040905162.1 bromodomain adjacent to zinc finger domain protein 2A [Toxotes jaculatrix]XP_040905170.1 bromodomain adjacent to zinc finger domain protein 2A [Toxotes jaculatrix]